MVKPILGALQNILGGSVVEVRGDNHFHLQEEKNEFIFLTDY